MSRALFLKRRLHSIKSAGDESASAFDRNVSSLFIKSAAKTDVEDGNDDDDEDDEDDNDYYPLAKVAAVFDPAHRYGNPLSYSLYATDASVVAPLDLSLKSNTPITPPSTPSPSLSSSRKNATDSLAPSAKTVVVAAKSRRKSTAKAKRPKANRKLNFDEDKSSPVSGTIIRHRSELQTDTAADHLVVQNGDIDPMYNVVEVTEEAKAELAKIENKIGDYVCKLCREVYKDAFSLAQHRCSCIVHVEYRCPECEKVFNCPANLASHRRWHKPKSAAAPASAVFDLRGHGSNYRLERTQPSLLSDSDAEDEPSLRCPICGEAFRRQSSLRTHLGQHHVVELQQLRIGLRQTAAAVPAAFAFHHAQTAN